MSTKKEIRARFRDEVFARDGFKCLFCGSTEKLDAHHIIDRHDMPNGGYVKENGITLCPVHHLDAEKKKVSAEMLFKMIGSSEITARLACGETLVRETEK